ncbi:hypothetical protein GYMLUDRAFT_225029 [Collybiopsis luxurians FD-317 M1]|uniref:Uncharacterized protein n=1 Tax=Collybiopsis luxurians FD-317 M1 TaxID=944289 RepID=A0A0D0CFH7_9AGAR|nr:hypothetical protein GYMLUDRAFT_225029 [Collybiopsis luxurians FD-317 M1]
MHRPSLLARKEPLDALCQHYNVAKTAYPLGMPLPAYFDMPITRDAHMPSHVLALYPTTTSSAPPLMVPVDAAMYNNGFRVDLIPPAIPGSLAPVPYHHPTTGIPTVSLPVVSISVPHVPSVPLLLLFGLRLETQTNLLAHHLLPAQVIEEFPNAAAMAQVMASLSDEELQRRVAYNQGIWKNVLALDLKDQSVVELIQTAWNVTAEARRLRW